MIAIKNTLFVGKVLKYFESASSTNALAAEWLQNGHNDDLSSVTPNKGLSLRGAKYTEGVVFFTFHQTAGRGQYGNKWESEPHQNIAISIVLNPTFLNPREQFHLNKAISLAVYDVIAQFVTANGVRQAGVASIKWANDIWVSGKKIAGILIENQLEGQQIRACVIGIGLNVNQINFSDEIGHKTTSFSLETKREWDREQILISLLQYIEIEYLALKKGQYATIDAY